MRASAPVRPASRVVSRRPVGQLTSATRCARCSSCHVRQLLFPWTVGQSLDAKPVFHVPSSLGLGRWSSVPERVGDADGVGWTSVWGCSVHKVLAEAEVSVVRG